MIRKIAEHCIVTKPFMQGSVAIAGNTAKVIKELSPHET